eukprot:1160389-Pelagomonas_calceolata.AAC.8
MPIFCVQVVLLLQLVCISTVDRLGGCIQGARSIILATHALLQPQFSVAVAVLAVCGRARQGKSWLLNQVNGNWNA